MAKLSARTLSGDVHHDADAAPCRIFDVEFTGADERHITKTGHTSGGCGKRGVDVIGSGEKDADDVVVVNAVSVDHFVEKGNGALLHLVDRVDLDCRGTAQGPH